mgnify:CR=1 FL=1
MKTESVNAIEGKISIILRRNENAPACVEVTSSRPVHAAKFLIGKTPEQALSIIPMLFSICGVAQSCAAISCIEQQLQLENAPGIHHARDLLVLAETAREHLLRIFLDWPRLFELEVNQQKLPFLSSLVNDFKSALFEQGQAFSLDSNMHDDISVAEALIDQLDCYLQDQVFCIPLQQWLEFKTVDSLHNWSKLTDCLAAHSILTICEHGWTTQGFCQLGQLPELNQQQLLDRFNAENASQFIQQPDWQGKQYETTSLSRQFNHPLIACLHREFDTSLITRWVARLVELAQIPQQMRALLQTINNTDNTQDAHSGQSAISQVEAARGRLIHHVKIEQQLITNYQILAPTEWNFHPQGLIAQSLVNIKAKDEQELKQLIRIMINAIDPCVGYHLDII